MIKNKTNEDKYALSYNLIPPKCRNKDCLCHQQPEKCEKMYCETDSLKSLHERVEDFVQIERYKAVNEYQTIMGLDIRSN